MKKAHLIIFVFAFFFEIANASPLFCKKWLRAVAPLDPSEIHYGVEGPVNAPPLLLIHGLGGSSRTFIDLIPKLRNKYRVIYYDQRGHGYTVQKGWDYSLDVMSSDLEALLNHLKIEKVHILGTSFGARTAMQFSYRNPDRVLSMLVEDMEMIPRVVDYEEEYLKKAKQSENLPRIFPSMQAIYDALRVFYSHEEALDAMQTVIKHSEHQFELLHRPHGMFLFDIGANGADLTKPLLQMKKPLLFVRADPKKSFFSDAGVAHVKQNRPDVKIITVLGAEHVVHNSNPETFLKIADDFFGNANAKRKNFFRFFYR